MLSLTDLTATSSKYRNSPEHTSSATGFSSFLKTITKELMNEEISMKCHDNSVFLIFSFFHICCSNFINLFNFPIKETNVFIKIYVDAGISIFMSKRDGLCPSIFCRKVDKICLMKEEIDREVFISRHSWQFHFHVLMMKLHFPIRNLTGRLNNCVSRQKKGIYSKKENIKGHTSKFWRP